MQRRASESFLTKPFFIVNVMRQTFLSIEFKFYKKIYFRRNCPEHK